MPKMNVNLYNTKDYGNVCLHRPPKTKPIQSQFKANQSQLKPIKYQNKAKTKPKQTQFKPKQTQFQNVHLCYSARRTPLITARKNVPDLFNSLPVIFTSNHSISYSEWSKKIIVTPIFIFFSVFIPFTSISDMWICFL